MNSNEGLQFALCAAAEDCKKLEWQEIIDDNDTLNELIPIYLRKKRLEPSDLTGIVVIQGKGGFSDTRSAVIFANMLGYTQNLPVLAVSDAYKDDLEGIVASLSNRFVKQIMPKYSGNPNISK